MGLWNPARADEDASRKGGGLAFPSDQVIRAGARNPMPMLKMRVVEKYFPNKIKF